MDTDPRAIWTRLAAGWIRHDELHTRCTAGVTERMIAGLRPGERVLDLACGTGDPALAAAARVGRDGRVVGLDVVEELLAHARVKAAALGLAPPQLELRCHGAESLPFPAASFDRVTIRWGLMYLSDPAACLAEAHRVLAPGGTLALACWGPPERNPWATILPAAVLRHAALPPAVPGPTGPFVLADADKLRALVAAAGFGGVELEGVDFAVCDLDRGEDFVAYRLDTSGPFTAVVMALPDEVRAAVLADAAADAERRGGGRAHVPGMTWIGLARR